MKPKLETIIKFLPGKNFPDLPHWFKNALYGAFLFSSWNLYRHCGVLRNGI